MTAAEWQRCKEAFGEALCLSEEARQSFLEGACGGDARLSGAVMQLLAQHGRSGRFLEPPLVSRSLHAALLGGRDGDEEEAGDRSDTIIGGRYRLRDRLGIGAVGEVYSADDLVTGDRVACKLLRRGRGRAWSMTFRREIAALRLLRIPGVARMIEEGAERGRPHIVMELVEGTPFPGVSRPAEWDTVAGTTLALLETLDRIHQAGFVHRDLKPGNVLVDAEGRPTVLDLGLALHPRRSVQSDEGVVGTPNYLAPEQVRGDPATPASDLYSVGVMIHEALTGSLPRRAGILPRLVRGRQPVQDAPAELPPTCPAAVAELVARLLRRDARDRPQTAAEAISLLRGPSSHPSPGRLPWLGSDEAIRTVAAAVERGASLDLHGEPGSGRTRCLEEAAARLDRAGRTVTWLRPGKGVADLLDAAESAALVRLDEAAELASARLAERLRSGAAVFVDDFSGLEPWVAAIVSASRPHGAVVRVLPEPSPGSLALGPLRRADLMGLFHGPDRIFHLREDAAGVLFARTHGWPGAVTDEVLSWVRAGIARWERGRLAVTREALDRLQGGRFDEPPRTGGRDLRLLPAPLRRVAAIVGIAAAQATPERLAPVLGRPAWQVDAQLRELESRGVVRLREGTPAEVAAPVDVLTGLSRDELRAAHARLAQGLPEGDEDRLRHLVGARELGPVPREVRLRAERLAKRGSFAGAIASLEQALITLRDDPDHPELLPVLEDLMLAGLRAWSPAPVNRVLYEIEMWAEQGPHVRRLGDVARSALALLQGTWERSLLLVESLEPFADVRLELARQTLRVLAARRGGVARERAAVAAVSEWAATCGLPEARRSLVVWLAWLRYNEGRFDESARLHRQAAELAGDPTSRTWSLAGRAAALADGQRLREALASVREALDALAALRDPALEARLLCTRRALEYRLDAAHDMDLELPELVALTGARDVEAGCLLTEAAVAWRTDRLDAARRLAARSARVWTELGIGRFTCLPEALRLASTPGAGEAEVRGVAARIARCPQPGLGVQALGLLAMARPDLSLALRIPDAWLQALPRRTWAVRREVLSVEEALYRRVERRERDGTADDARGVRGKAAGDGLRPQ